MKYLILFLSFLAAYILFIPHVALADDNITGGVISNGQFRDGNFTMSDIPIFIAGVTKFVIEIAGTVAIFSLIYHAVQMQINSGITGDSSGVDKAKKGMYSSLIGFVVALLSWFIVTRVVEILTTATS